MSEKTRIKSTAVGSKLHRGPQSSSSPKLPRSRAIKTTRRTRSATKATPKTPNRPSDSGPSTNGLPSNSSRSNCDTC